MLEYRLDLVWSANAHKLFPKSVDHSHEQSLSIPPVKYCPFCVIFASQPRSFPHSDLMLASPSIKDKTMVLDQEGALVKIGVLGKTGAWWTRGKWDCGWEA